MKLTVETETLLETVNTSTGIYDLLLAGEEGMTLGADFNADVLSGRTSLNDIAASASYGSCFILGMQILFHCI